MSRGWKQNTNNNQTELKRLIEESSKISDKKNLNKNKRSIFFERNQDHNVVLVTSNKNLREVSDNSDKPIENQRRFSKISSDLFTSFPGKEHQFEFSNFDLWLILTIKLDDQMVISALAPGRR